MFFLGNVIETKAKGAFCYSSVTEVMKKSIQDVLGGHCRMWLQVIQTTPQTELNSDTFKDAKDVDLQPEELKEVMPYKAIPYNYVKC